MDRNIQFCPKVCYLSSYMSLYSLKRSGLSEHPTEYYVTNYLDDIMLIRLDEQEIASTIEDISEMKNKPMKIQYSATLANLCEESSDNICPSKI